MHTHLCMYLKVFSGDIFLIDFLLQRIYLFHLSCQIYCHKAIYNILLLFLVSIASLVMSFLSFLIWIIYAFSLFLHLAGSV